MKTVMTNLPMKMSIAGGIKDREVNPDISPVAVAKRRRCPWIQGAAIEAPASVSGNTVRKPIEYNAVDSGISAVAVGNW